ncbi:MAG: peptide-methionine (R)-S-oxide reductase MsrB [Alphaproteobacteria bacterium]
MPEIKSRYLFLLALIQSTTALAAIDYMAQPDEFWRKHLNEDQYYICRSRGTERAGTGEYDKFYEEGTYYCACCGGDFPLFSSETKFDSETGWPSFWDVVSKDAVIEQEDDRIVSRLFGARTEILCGRCGSHLGHVFNDGPQDKTGLRYCMNSLALSFSPKGVVPKNAFEDPVNNPAQSLYVSFCDAYRSRDLESLMGLFSDTASFIGAADEICLGVNEIRQKIVRDWEQSQSGEINIKSFLPVSGSQACTMALADASVNVNGEQIVMQKLRVTIAAEKIADKWKIVHMHGSFAHPGAKEDNSFPTMNNP